MSLHLDLSCFLMTGVSHIFFGQECQKMNDVPHLRGFRMLISPITSDICMVRLVFVGFLYCKVALASWW